MLNGSLLKKFSIWKGGTASGSKSIIRWDSKGQPRVLVLELFSCVSAVLLAALPHPHSKIIVWDHEQRIGFAIFTWELKGHFSIPKSIVPQ